MAVTHPGVAGNLPGGVHVVRLPGFATTGRPAPLATSNALVRDIPLDHGAEGRQGEQGERLAHPVDRVERMRSDGQLPLCREHPMGRRATYSKSIHGARVVTRGAAFVTVFEGFPGVVRESPANAHQFVPGPEVGRNFAGRCRNRSFRSPPESARSGRRGPRPVSRTHGRPRCERATFSSECCRRPAQGWSGGEFGERRNAVGLTLGTCRHHEEFALSVELVSVRAVSLTRPLNMTNPRAN